MLSLDIWVQVKSQYVLSDNVNLKINKINNPLAVEVQNYKLLAEEHCIGHDVGCASALLFCADESDVCLISTTVNNIKTTCKFVCQVPLKPKEEGDEDEDIKQHQNSPNNERQISERIVLGAGKLRNVL